MPLELIDKKSPEQLYLQIRRVILQAIQGRELRPSEQMPSIGELSTTMGVSRMTVRHALGALINEGWLYTVPGKGTFVSNKPMVEQSLQRLMGWTDEIRAQGFRPATRVVSSEVVAAERSVADALRLAPGSPICRFVRVRLANDYGLAVEAAHLSAIRFPGLETFIQDGRSLYQTIEAQFGISLVRASQVMEAGAADPQTANLLGIPVGNPVLITERIAYAADDSPVEFVRAWHRAGLVRFRTDMSGDSLVHHAWMREIAVTRSPSER